MKTPSQILVKLLIVNCLQLASQTQGTRPNIVITLVPSTTYPMTLRQALMFQ